MDLANHARNLISPLLHLAVAHFKFDGAGAVIDSPDVMPIGRPMESAGPRAPRLRGAKLGAAEWDRVIPSRNRGVIGRADRFMPTEMGKARWENR